MLSRCFVLKSTAEEIVKSNERLMMRSFPSRTPIVVVEGKGAILKDVEGKEYIDCFSGIAVTNVGHCHPRVVAAAKEQLEKLWHCSGLYYTLPMTRLAEKLVTIMPGGLNKFFFANSGAEAVEGAVKLAKKYALKKGRCGFWMIALECSFHGRTALTLSLTGQNKYKKYMGNFANNPGVAHAMAPYCYRCPLKYPECDLYCATSLEDLIERRTTGDVAAFIVEPIIGEGGIIVPPDEYPVEVAKVCKDHGAILIADEVQTGFGRTGKMFAVEYWKVAPDIITMAKGLGAGLPIGAFAAAEEVGECVRARRSLLNLRRKPRLVRGGSRQRRGSDRREATGERPSRRKDDDGRLERPRQEVQAHRRCEGAGADDRRGAGQRPSQEDSRG
jgi:4-aminobutyrate aminotransferase/(S)-3-amino-2-methylpropionate transaminase